MGFESTKCIKVESGQKNQTKIARQIHLANEDPYEKSQRSGENQMCVTPGKFLLVTSNQMCVKSSSV